MKDVMLKITGYQLIPGNEEEETSQFVTMGKVYKKGDDYYIVYEETDISGLEGNTATIKISKDSARVLRFGKKKEIQSRLDFEIGQSIESIYMTPAGPMKITVKTDQIENGIESEDKGRVSIRYLLDFMNSVEVSARLTIEFLGGKNEQQSS